MTTVSTAEAKETLPELIGRREPVMIREGDQNVAMLISLVPKQFNEEERQLRWSRFLKTRDSVAAELEASLAKDGITVEEFLKDALED